MIFKNEKNSFTGKHYFYRFRFGLLILMAGLLLGCGIFDSVAGRLRALRNQNENSSPGVEAEVAPADDTTTNPLRDKEITPSPVNIDDTGSSGSASQVTLTSDGAGDFATLGEAVATLSPGSVITLGAGTFNLSNPLDIDKPLTLRGAGPEQTKIVSEAAGYVVKYTGDMPLAIDGVAFEHTGEKPANVLDVVQGIVDFKNCRFSGGIRSEEEKVDGGGLILRNSVTGSVKNCQAEDNGWAGIAVINEAQLTLEENSCSNNAVGILFIDNASGTARNNECRNNSFAGIMVGDWAAPVIVGNELHDNESAGIFYEVEEGGGGEARENNLQDNNTTKSFDNGTDIQVFGPHAPALISNTCSRESTFGSSALGGDMSGIVFVSRGDLPQNPILEDNACKVARCSTPTGSLLNMTCK